MIAQAQASLARLGLTGSFYQADAEEWVWTQPAACKDLIVSGACFQWFFRPEQTIRGLCRLLAPNAPLYFSTFGPDTFANCTIRLPMHTPVWAKKGYGTVCRFYRRSSGCPCWRRRE